MLRRIGAGRFAISETVFSRVRGFFFGRRPDARRSRSGAMPFAAPPFGEFELLFYYNGSGEIVKGGGLRPRNSKCNEGKDSDSTCSRLRRSGGCATKAARRTLASANSLLKAAHRRGDWCKARRCRGAGHQLGTTGACSAGGVASWRCGPTRVG
jgi:hypothetical protein